jgi:hypothetical protein
MIRNYTATGKILFIETQVGGTDRYCPHADQNLTRAGLRRGNLLHADFTSSI